MPGITLVARETMNSVCNCSYSRGSGQMCRQEPHIQLSQEEQNAAEESLSVYCKPVELYNILQRRAINNPLFLQRCLRYKLQAKNKRRIQISVSISGAINDGMYAQNLFPLYVLLARPLSTTNMEHSAVYRFSQACRLTAFNGAETQSAAHAKFLLPEISKLSAEVKSGSLAMLLVSCAAITNCQGIDLTMDHIFSASSMFEGNCLLGKIPMDLLHLSWERSPNLSLGGRAEMMASVSMRYCDMKLSGLDEEKCISFRFQYNSEAVSILQQVPVMVSAEELGAKDISAYDLYSYSDIPDNSLPHIVRLRAGNVVFKYKYYNDMLQRSEVTEDFTCPFCLVRCASYTGLRFHLTSSHDLFRFQFWVNEDYQVVNVSVKTDICNSEIAADGVDPRQQTFSFCHKPKRHRKPKNLTQNANHVHPFLLDSDVPEGAKCDTYSPNATSVSIATGVSFAEPESGQSVPGSNLAPPAMLQFAKTRKLSVERSDPRNRALLQKRQFFHSHRAQPMALEQVFAEQDSEDEVDDDVADLEDRRMLDDFVDVAKEEKHMMHLWNSFVRKQRVLADGHIPWACEAFSKLHGKNFLQNPKLLWCWKLLIVKLWNHGLVDSRTMNKCNQILDHIHPTTTTTTTRSQM
ncbi:polycomb group protein EMBRYONIC FLOWER 2-like isoform X2 [Cynara cardunculus var. scolymus]|uniref:polycomb group protein EMBRYONIC FLOWER 2-like isoform X2 n=1 Tax=Cynara cardunculus var. scolymus TaxID=59895 RepID=UPI000D62B157|nr:polycomb group protein EMBRYONIC FLOWER 2-like isoform X2 [Cynara cardunculus var. scolymus]